MPRLTGKSSQGSKPTTWLSLTLSWMPHCTPQKQQWVFTSLSASPAAPQPPAGVSLRCGPYWAISASSVTGILATACSRIAKERLPLLPSLGGPPRIGIRDRQFAHDARMGQAQSPTLASRAEIDLQPDAGLSQDVLQVRQVRGRGEAFPAAAAAGLRNRLAVPAMKDHGKVERPLEDVEELSKRDVEQRGAHRDGVDERERGVARAAEEVGAEGEHQPRQRDRQQQQERHDVVAELLPRHRSRLTQAPPQRERHARDHHD